MKQTVIYPTINGDRFTVRGGKAICLCATLYKGGGNNSVTYIIELYES